MQQKTFCVLTEWGMLLRNIQNWDKWNRKCCYNSTWSVATSQQESRNVATTQQENRGVANTQQEHKSVTPTRQNLELLLQLKSKQLKVLL